MLLTSAKVTKSINVEWGNATYMINKKCWISHLIASCATWDVVDALAFGVAS